MKEVKRSGFSVSPEDYNNEEIEPKEYFQKEITIDFPFYEPDSSNKPADKDIFKNAEFWLAQGHLKQQRSAQNAGPD